MFLVAADDDGEDDAVAGAGEDVIAVDVAPLVARGWAAEVVGVPVGYGLAAVPILVADMLAFLPVVVMDILLMVVVVMVAVVVILGQGEGTGQRESEGGNSKNSAKWFHGCSSKGGIRGRAVALFDAGWRNG
jgi:hypothetical protein